MISEVLKNNSTLTELYLSGDEKEQKGNRLNNKEKKKRKRRIKV